MGNCPVVLRESSVERFQAMQVVAGEFRRARAHRDVQAAIPEGRLEPWNQRLESPPRRYEGEIHPDSIVLNVGGSDRVFRRVAATAERAATPCRP